MLCDGGWHSKLIVGRLRPHPGRRPLIDWSVNADCTPLARRAPALPGVARERRAGSLRCPTDGARGSGGGGEALRARGRVALGRDRLGRPAHLRLLLARLAHPGQGRLRRGRRPVVGGVRDDLGPLPAGRAAALAHDRRAPGARAADRPAAAGRGDDSARRRGRVRRRGARVAGPAAGRPPVRQTRPCTGSWSPPCSPSRPASSPGAFWPAAGASLSTAPSCSPSRPRGCRSPSRSPSGSPAGRPRSPSGSSPRPLLSLTVVPLAFAGRAVARSRAPATPSAPASGESEFTLAAGGGFAAAVLLIMVSEQTPPERRAAAGPGLRGSGGGGLHLQRADDRPRPAGPLPGGGHQPPAAPDAAALQRRPRRTRRRSGSRSGSRSARSPPSPRRSAWWSLIAGPELMQLAFGKKFSYDRLGLLIVTAGMGFYLSSGTLNQAALAQGQVRRAAACWVVCALAFIGWNLLPVLDEFRRVEVGFAGAAALLCGLLYLPLPPPARSSGGRRRARLAAGAGGAVGRRRRGELTAASKARALRLLAPRRPPRSAGRPRPDPGRRTPRIRRRTGSLPPRRRCPPSSASTPPSTSIAAAGARPRSLATLSGEAAMKGCPPQPGFTDMQRITSADSVQLRHRVGGRPGVERQARQAAGLADRAEGAVSVGVGLEVEGDAVGARPGELGDLIGGALDHQVDVERAAGLVDLVGDRARDQRPDGDRRDEVAVHDVDVDQPRAGGHHLGDLGAEPREVGGEDRRRDSPAANRSRGELARVSPVAASIRRPRSIEWPQCWQSMSSEALMRTIVWCSPQFGHCETSS